ncbi:cation transporter [Arcanobacterium haemolyticum]|nr:cation transporter [Arcanobacterium haemolyticum]
MFVGWGTSRPFSACHSDSRQRLRRHDPPRFAVPNNVPFAPIDVLTLDSFLRPSHNGVVSEQKNSQQSDPTQRSSAPSSVNLAAFAWLSIAAALATIALKTAAYVVSGSVGLLSDAVESGVNLVAAVIALIALKQAAKPADNRYTYGRSKVEYFSAAVEGAMIFAAAATIIFTAVMRIASPTPLDNLGLGLAVSVVASIINAFVGFILLRAGRKHRSPTLSADGSHLMTDVITSIGVLIGIGLVALTGWERLDPIIALLVGINITVTGVRLVRSSLAGLMDVTLPDEQNRLLVAVLASHTTDDVSFHGLQTRQAGRESFANVDMLVPGSWSVREGHERAENVIDELRRAVPGLRVLIHVEPIEDPRSYDDIPDGFIPLPAPHESIEDACGVGTVAPPRFSGEDVTTKPTRSSSQ